MVDAADGKDDPPPELEIIWGCRRYNCLPEAGGYMDQDAKLMYTGTTYDNVYNFVRTFRSMDKPDFAKLDAASREIFLWLVKLEVRF